MWTEESFWETVSIYQLKINICKIKSKSWKQRAEICHTRFIKHTWGNMTAERFQASPHKERFTNNNTFLITSCDACWEQNARLWVLLFPSLCRLSGLLSALNRWNKDTVSFFFKGVTVTSDIFTSVNSINGVLQRSAVRAPPSKRNPSCDKANKWKRLAGPQGFTPRGQVAARSIGAQGIPTVSACQWCLKPNGMSYEVGGTGTYSSYIYYIVSDGMVARTTVLTTVPPCSQYIRAVPRRAALSLHLCLRRSDRLSCISVTTQVNKKPKVILFSHLL